LAVKSQRVTVEIEFLGRDAAKFGVWGATNLHFITLHILGLSLNAPLTPDDPRVARTRQQDHSEGDAWNASHHNDAGCSPRAWE